MRAGHLALAPVWTGDGARLRVLISARGSVHLVEGDVAGGSLRTLVGGERVLLDFDGGGDRIVFTASMPTDPGDVFAVDGLEERRLTCVNADLLESLALAAPSRWRSSRPAASRSRAGSCPGARPGERPLILEIHGGPHALYGNAFFHELQVLSAKGYHVLYTNPRGSRGYGERFCGEIAEGGATWTTRT